MKTAAAGLLIVAFSLIAGTLFLQPPHFHQTTIPVGHGPRWISIADINHDNNPDILVTNEVSETITVLLGDGQGHFREAPGSPVPAGHLPNDIGISDLNGDGNLDLVVANHQSPYVTILLGDGKGAFHPAPGSPLDVHSNPHPHAVAVADFNHDGRPDFVTESWASNQIELFLGNGNGTFATPGRFFSVGHRPYERLRSADFNHDGLPDVVTTNLDDDTVTILLSDGKGGFHPAPGSPVPAGSKPWQIFIDDLNGDGNPDLVIIPYQRDLTDTSRNAVTVLLGDAKARFKPAPPLPLNQCRGVNSVAAGDLRGNGKHAIVVACAESRNMILFEPNSSGHYEGTAIPVKGGWGGIALAKLTHANHSEIITADNDQGTITIYTPE